MSASDKSSDTSLVGDLESLRSLLDEAAPTQQGSFGDDTIKALLGDEWRESADQILATAREAIESVASKWSPQQTTELNQALRVRIDATLEDWLEVVIQQRLEDLRATLLAAIETEISAFTARLQQRDPDGE
jgi:hypothetical protein